MSIGYPVIRKGSGENNTVMVDIGGNACLDSGLMIICDIIIGEMQLKLGIEMDNNYLKEDKN